MTHAPRHQHSLRRIRALARRKGFELTAVPGTKRRYRLNDLHKRGLIELNPAGRFDFSLREAATLLLPLHDRPLSH